MREILNLLRILVRDEDSARELFKWFKNLFVRRPTASSSSSVFSSIMSKILNLLNIFLRNPEARTEISNRLVILAEKLFSSDDGGDDIISKLPDEILHQIMYLAGSRKAVQASILSKRWRYLWASSPLVNFDFEEFSGTTDPNESLEHFAQKFTLLRNDDQSKIIRLRIDSARLDMKEFEASSRGGSSALIAHPETPHRFSCLRTLKLRKLVGWSLRDARFGVEMMPALEELYIALTDFKSVDIQMDRLKVLKLWKCQALEGVIRVSAPNLQTLDCRMICASSLCMEDDLSSLSDVVADITIDNKDGDAPSKVRKMFARLHNATSLTLSTSTVEELKLQKDFFKRLPNFHNLKCVVVMLDTSAQPIQITKDLLQLWPKLKTLEIKYIRY